ncbi:MAG: hypothetical protein NUV65_06735 [Candidatus Roizmanbacteria bacterium]|nr:hypothetical protein [Candidatus Roizmanbacteria bacterium]
MDDNKNEKVVHTRVSKELYDKISSKAKKHRISTSNLLRNLVEDYLEIHGEVWDAIDKKLRSYIDSGEDSIVGYQSITLNKDVHCSLCGKPLKKGSQAFIGFFEKSTQKIIVCANCKDKEKVVEE